MIRHALDGRIAAGGGGTWIPVSSGQVRTLYRVTGEAASSLIAVGDSCTEIRYRLATAGVVRLIVYDVLGRKVQTLADGMRPAGEHFVHWDAPLMPSGVYFCQLSAGGNSETRRMPLVRLLLNLIIPRIAPCSRQT